MKSLIRITAFLVLVSTLPVRANDAEWAVEPGRLGVLQPATTLLGKKVHDEHGKNLGTLADLLVDLSSGRVLFAMVAIDNSQLVPVPAQSYAYLVKGRVTLGVSRAVFLSAPRIAKADALSALDPARRTAIFRHFSQAEPEWPASPALSLTRITGVPVMSTAREPIGLVKELMVDLQRGRMTYLVIAPQLGMGSASDLYLVPPVAARPDPAALLLVLNVDRAKFLAGPHFDKEFWADIASPTLAANVCQHYGLSAAPAESVAEQPQTAARSDSEINQAIMTELVRQVRGLATLKIVVTTIHGRVTLSGMVKNSAQKRVVLSAAEHIVGAGNIDDHLETHSRARATEL